MFINKNILNIYNIIIDFFAHKIINDVNVFNANMKLNVLYENDYALIIFKNNDNFEIRIIKSQKLIKKVFQSNNFFNNLYLIDIFYFINEKYYNNLTFIY